MWNSCSTCLNTWEKLLWKINWLWQDLVCPITSLYIMMFNICAHDHSSMHRPNHYTQSRHMRPCQTTRREVSCRVWTKNPWDRGRILHNCLPLVSVGLVWSMMSLHPSQRLLDRQLISVMQTLACPVSFPGILPLTPPFWDIKAVTQPTGHLDLG